MPSPNFIEDEIDYNCGCCDDFPVYQQIINMTVYPHPLPSFPPVYNNPGDNKPYTSYEVFGENQRDVYYIGVKTLTTGEYILDTNNYYDGTATVNYTASLNAVNNIVSKQIIDGNLDKWVNPEGFVFNIDIISTRTEDTGTGYVGASYGNDTESLAEAGSQIKTPSSCSIGSNDSALTFEGNESTNGLNISISLNDNNTTNISFNNTTDTLEIKLANIDGVITIAAKSLIGDYTGYLSSWNLNATLICKKSTNASGNAPAPTGSSSMTGGDDGANHSNNLLTPYNYSTFGPWNLATFGTSLVSLTNNQNSTPPDSATYFYEEERESISQLGTPPNTTPYATTTILETRDYNYNWSDLVTQGQIINYINTFKSGYNYPFGETDYVGLVGSEGILPTEFVTLASINPLSYTELNNDSDGVQTDFFFPRLFISTKTFYPNLRFKYTIVFYSWDDYEEASPETISTGIENIAVKATKIQDPESSLKSIPVFGNHWIPPITFESGKSGYYKIKFHYIMPVLP